MRLFDKFEKKWICLPIYPYSTDNLIVIHLLEQQSYLYLGYIINGMSDSTKAVKKKSSSSSFIFNSTIPINVYRMKRDIYKNK